MTALRELAELTESGIRLRGRRLQAFSRACAS
jgi:hypothetical protein